MIKGINKFYHDLLRDTNNTKKDLIYSINRCIFYYYGFDLFYSLNNRRIFIFIPVSKASASGIFVFDYNVLFFVFAYGFFFIILLLLFRRIFRTLCFYKIYCFN